MWQKYYFSHMSWSTRSHSFNLCFLFEHGFPKDIIRAHFNTLYETHVKMPDHGCSLTGTERTGQERKPLQFLLTSALISLRPNSSWGGFHFSTLISVLRMSELTQPESWSAKFIPNRQCSCRGLAHTPPAILWNGKSMVDHGRTRAEPQGLSVWLVARGWPKNIEGAVCYPRIASLTLLL
jgi:hypothetical protein